jgi:hypothetical protein
MSCFVLGISWSDTSFLLTGMGPAFFLAKSIPESTLNSTRINIQDFFMIAPYTSRIVRSKISCLPNSVTYSFRQVIFQGAVIYRSKKKLAEIGDCRIRGFIRIEM